MDETKTIAGIICPTPLPAKDTVVLGHGSGGKLSAELVRSIFLPAFQNPALAKLNDQAVLNVNGTRLAFTTDSFVVKPLFFPGGNIGSLAVHGTINDLAMCGARPLFLSVAFILEEGFSLNELRRVVDSLSQAAADAGVQVVTGDTKVVERGSGDQLFINTTGIGLVPEGLELSADQARPGDKILLSGYIGDHGIAILAQREGLEFESPIQSDSAALHGLVAEMLEASAGISGEQRVRAHSLHARSHSRRSVQRAERNCGAVEGRHPDRRARDSYSRRGARRLRDAGA